ncbi:HIV Tat-specific factor 1 homolog [Frankliniella occidentalis]|uniref:HIV Tat-specific factor 1 homolog n=1 Tax=Frankliniella occidentalis TaxID=133901 RepID=A0A9C6U7B7_FRAOC|nr:HIV Tat-specific factor 1 homolog [Frankliniella occidentalis]
MKRYYTGRSKATRHRHRKIRKDEDTSCESSTDSEEFEAGKEQNVNTTCSSPINSEPGYDDGCETTKRAQNNAEQSQSAGSGCSVFVDESQNAMQKLSSNLLTHVSIPRKLKDSHKDHAAQNNVDSSPSEKLLTAATSPTDASRDTGDDDVESADLFISDNSDEGSSLSTEDVNCDGGVHEATKRTQNNAERSPSEKLLTASTLPIDASLDAEDNDVESVDLFMSDIDEGSSLSSEDFCSDSYIAHYLDEEPEQPRIENPHAEPQEGVLQNDVNPGGHADHDDPDDPDDPEDPNDSEDLSSSDESDEEENNQQPANLMNNHLRMEVELQLHSNLTKGEVIVLELANAIRHRKTFESV